VAVHIILHTEIESRHVPDALNNIRTTPIFVLLALFTQPIMLSSAALVLALLPSFAVAQTTTTDAKCLAGFDWVRGFYHS